MGKVKIDGVVKIMNSVLFATITANGFIADEKGEEDIFCEYNWEIFKNLVLKYGNVIWGRKTYEMIMNWGDNYINDFDTIKIMVISESDKYYNDSNVTVCKDLNTAINLLESQNLTPFIAGGSSIYSSALKQNLVEEIILNFNSIFIPDGVKLFNDMIFYNSFKINYAKKISDDILQISLMK